MPPKPMRGGITTHIWKLLPHYISSLQSGGPFTGGSGATQSTEVLSGNLRVPECVKESVHFIYPVALNYKIIVLSRSRTVFLKCVIEEEYLSSAAWSHLRLPRDCYLW